jgi:hypothetical protein
MLKILESFRIGAVGLGSIDVVVGELAVTVAVTVACGPPVWPFETPTLAPMTATAIKMTATTVINLNPENRENQRK